MKHFFAVLVCALLGTAFATINEDQVKQSIRNLGKAHETCNADPATHVDPEAARASRQGGALPPNALPHILCVSKTLGWQNADGSVNVEVIRAKAQAIYGDHPKLQEVVDECAKDQGSPEATAQYLYNCYRKNTPRPSGTRPRNN